MMETVREQIEAFEVIRREFRAVADRTDQARKPELVALRRRLALMVGQLGETGAALFGDGSAVSHLAPSFRKRFSQMRSGLALHQARWPAVCIDDDPVAYRQSAVDARVAERACLEWLRLVLDGLDGKSPMPEADPQ